MSLPWTGAEAYTVQIVSNVNWRAELTVVSGGEGWIAKTAPAADVEGDGAVVLSVSENESTESRQAKLTVVYVDDPTVKAELTINQQKQGERHRIEFAGMTTLLGNDGNTTLEYAPAGGGESVILNDVEVEVGTDLTTVYYMEEIPDGEYELKKVGSVEINALFTLSNGQISYVERWNPAFGCFGGESEERPIAIGKRSDLEALASSVSGRVLCGHLFVQTADIALGGSWTAIGTSDKKFSGNYDGRDFAITGLKIAPPRPDRDSSAMSAASRPRRTGRRRPSQRRSGTSRSRAPVRRLRTTTPTQGSTLRRRPASSAVSRRT